MAAAWRGSLAGYVKEIRIHLCQKSPSSQGVRYVGFILILMGSYGTKLFVTIETKVESCVAIALFLTSASS